jgi:hypothetical protein
MEKVKTVGIQADNRTRSLQIPSSVARHSTMKFGRRDNVR